jgi:hypothetical protein
MNLEKLAEAIEQKWADAKPVIFDDGDGHIQLRVNSYHEIHCDPSDDDEYNARWYNWCLDRLEELGYESSLATTASAKGLVGYRLSATIFATPFHFKTHGATRAEACTKALCAALVVE